MTEAGTLKTYIVFDFESLTMIEDSYDEGMVVFITAASMEDALGLLSDEGSDFLEEPVSDYRIVELGEMLKFSRRFTIT